MNNTQKYFALGSLLIGAPFVGFSATLDTFDTFPSPGINLSSTGAIARDNSGISADTVPGADTSFTSLSRRASIQRLTGSTPATLANTLPSGSFNWSNATGVTSTAMLRYDFSSPQAFQSAGQNLLTFNIDDPELFVNLTIDVFSSSATGGANYNPSGAFYAANPYITKTINNAFFC